MATGKCGMMNAECGIQHKDCQSAVGVTFIFSYTTPLPTCPSTSPGGTIPPIPHERIAMSLLHSCVAYLKKIVLPMLFAATAGCGYAVPGRGADFAKLGLSPAQRDQQTDPAISKLLERKPLASFPATIAVVRIEAGQYSNPKLQTCESGGYTVVLTHDVEKPELFAQLAKLPMLAGLEPINRLELPSVTNRPSYSMQMDLDHPVHLDDLTDPTSSLRTAAAMVHADMLLIYTFDDAFDDRDLFELGTVATLGLSPNKSLTVTSTASAVLIDTRNGYIYGAAEASEKKNTLANCWGENAAADAVREEVEGKAFEKLCGELTTTWTQVVRQYATAPAPTAKP
jgi:hypothetical protein